MIFYKNAAELCILWTANIKQGNIQHNECIALNTNLLYIHAKPLQYIKPPQCSLYLNQALFYDDIILKK